MQIVEIVADRFAVADDHCVIDLATGTPVVLRLGVGGGTAEQTRWSIRCDGLHQLRHPRLAVLVDYGALGASRRFEAWQCGPRWRGAPEEAASTRRATSQYLRVCGLTDDDGTAGDVHECDGRAVIVPSGEAGYFRDHAGATELEKRSGLVEAVSLDNCGVRTIDRTADAVVADLFASLGGSRPHIVSMWGPPGSGRTTAAFRAARVARLNGFVPDQRADPQPDRCRSRPGSSSVCHQRRRSGNPVGGIPERYAGVAAGSCTPANRPGRTSWTARSRT